MKRLSGLILAGLLALQGPGATAPAIAGDAPPAIVASIPPVHSLVARVMAGVGEPALLIPATASPHNFTLRPSDARKLGGADIVFWIGPQLETALAGPLEALAGSAERVALLAAPGIERLPTREGGVWSAHDHRGHSGHAHQPHPRDEDGADEQAHNDHGDDHGDTDAHIWL
ncbi:MAG: zinc ABC transporter substrate-binding protein, partial [Alphaproteobacteria bacterium]